MNKHEAAAHRLRRRLTAEYGTLYSLLTDVLREADPIGLGPDAPPDEYEPEVSTILPRLREARSAGDLQEIIHAEFVRWFDQDSAGPSERYAGSATAVWRALEAQRKDA